MQISSEVLVVIIGSTISLITSTIAGVLSLRASNKRTRADQELITAQAADKISEATERQMANVNMEIGRLQKAIEVLRMTVSEYKRGTKILIAQLVSAGIDPKWQPPE